MININMIAERRARKLREMTILRMSILGVLLIALVVGLLNLLAVIEVGTENKRIAQLEVTLDGARVKKAELDRIEARIRQREPVVNLLKQVQASEAAWMIILADFSRIMPDDVHIAGISSSLSPAGVELNISGTALDEETVGAFMIAVREKTYWAQNPVPGTITAVGDSPAAGVRFSLTIPVRGLYGGEIK